MVDPLEKVSGSTSDLWLVAAEALQVAWVKGSLLICSGADAAEASKAGAARTSAAAAAVDSAILRSRVRETPNDIVPPRARAESKQKSPCVIDCIHKRHTGAGNRVLN